MTDDALIQESARGLVEWFTSTAQSGEQFIIEQAPLYAQEVVAWAFWSGLIGGVVCAIIAVFIVAAACWVAPRTSKAWQDLSTDGSEFWAVGGSLFLTFGGIGLLVCCITGPLCILRAVQAHVAPRVVILEHVQGLL